MALHTAIYLSLMGPEGLKEVNRLSFDGAHYLCSELTATGKMHLLHPDKPFFNEMLMKVPAGNVDAILAALLHEGIFGGVKLADDLLLIAVTEKLSKADCDRYVSLVNAI